MYLDKVAVTSRSFSKNLCLCKRLQESFVNVKFNINGTKLEYEVLVEFLQNANCAIIGLEKIDGILLDNLPDLKFICKVGTGVDKVDLEALKERNIKFAATPGVNKRSVSELVLGLIIALQRHLISVNALVKQEIWLQPTGRLLSNKKVGIIGFGAIGQDLAKLLSVFDCECLIYDIEEYNGLMSHIKQVSFDNLLEKSDIISLHIPYSFVNHHIIGAKELAKMKPEAVLINTARGGLIDEDALYFALKEGNLAAAALDVFEQEPKISEKLLKLDNFIATSHIGGSTHEAIVAMGMLAIETLENMIGITR